jgi:hypothetical protein
MAAGVREQIVAAAVPSNGEHRSCNMPIARSQSNLNVPASVEPFGPCSFSDLEASLHPKDGVEFLKDDELEVLKGTLGDFEIIDKSNAI